MQDPADRTTRLRDGAVVLALLAVVAPLGIAYATWRAVLRAGLELVSLTSRRRRVLLVISRSPVWRPYIEQHWLPRLADRAVVLDGSDRARWRRHPSLAACTFFHWAPRRGFVPMVLVVPPLGAVRVISFHRAYRDWKHGDPRALRAAEGEMFALVDAVTGAADRPATAPPAPPPAPHAPEPPPPATLLHLASGRRAVVLRAARVEDVRPVTAAPYVLLLASERAEATLTAAHARAWIDAGAAWVCAWGPASPAVEAAFDDATFLPELGPPLAFTLMTTAHADEPLEDALDLAFEGRPGPRRPPAPAGRGGRRRGRRAPRAPLRGVDPEHGPRGSLIRRVLGPPARSPAGPPPPAPPATAPPRRTHPPPPCVSMDPRPEVRVTPTPDDPRILLPTEAQVSERLAAILARGNRKFGPAAGTERLLLMLTRSCELRCSYCFVQKTESGTDMTVETAEQGVDLFMRSRRPRLEIQFFGGEPTRRWDLLTHVFRYASQHPARAGRKLDFIVTTNGTGLDEDRVAFLEGFDTTVLFSLDGDQEAHRRFRPALLASDEDAWRRIRRTVGVLLSSRIHWFANVTCSPSASAEVPDRYAWARRIGLPRFQMNYSVGHFWRPEQEQRYLVNLQRMLLDHAERPDGMLLYNWLSECEPVMLSDELMVDVDGTVLHDGAVFLERSLPRLKQTYDRGHVATLDDFDSLRWTLAKLDEVMRATYSEGSREHRAIVQNIRMGAAVDLVIDHVRALTGRERPGLRGDGTFGALPEAAAS